MKIFELKPLFFTSVEFSLEDRDTCIELKENVGVLSFEVLHKWVIWLQQNSWRVFNVVCTSLRPVVRIFYDNLIQRVTVLLLDGTFNFIVDVYTFLNIFDIFHKLLYLWNTTFFLNLFYKIFLKGYDLTYLKILWKLNIFKQSICHMLWFFIDKSHFFLKNLEKINKLFIEVAKWL